MEESNNFESPKKSLFSRLREKVFVKRGNNGNIENITTLAQLISGDEQHGVVDGNSINRPKKKNQNELDTTKKILGEIDPLLPEIYRALINNFPEIAKVAISTRKGGEDPRLSYTGGFWLRPGTKGENPRIVIARDDEHYLKLLVKRKKSVEKAAADLGITLNDIRNNPKILKLFILFHELGHANEYMTKFANNSDVTDPAAESRAVVDAELSSLPVPHKNPTSVRKMLEDGSLVRVLANLHQEGRFIQIISPEELFDAHEDGYRKMPTEVYADNFAVVALKPFLTRLLEL